VTANSGRRSLEARWPTPGPTTGASLEIAAEDGPIRLIQDVAGIRVGLSRRGDLPGDVRLGRIRLDAEVSARKL